MWAPFPSFLFGVVFTIGFCDLAHSLVYDIREATISIVGNERADDGWTGGSINNKPDEDGFVLITGRKKCVHSDVAMTNVEYAMKTQRSEDRSVTCGQKNGWLVLYDEAENRQDEEERIRFDEILLSKQSSK